MAKDSFDYENTLKYLENLGVIKQDFDTFLKQFLLDQAKKVVINTKLRQRAADAIDTGAMINSWYIGKQHIELKEITPRQKARHSNKAAVTIDEPKTDIADIRVVGNVLQVEIGNPQEYASYIEYGHHLNQRKSTFEFGKGVTTTYHDGYKGVHMLELSISEVREAMPKRFHEDFKKWLNSKGFDYK